MKSFEALRFQMRRMGVSQSEEQVVAHHPASSRTQEVNRRLQIAKSQFAEFSNTGVCFFLLLKGYGLLIRRKVNM